MKPLKHFFSGDASLQRVRTTIVGAAIVLMIVVTAISEIRYSSRQLQVSALAGRQVSMEKLADVFLGMDTIAMENHFRRLWTYNGMIFLGALLVFGALKDAKK